MTSQQRTEALILLYSSTTQTTKVLHQSLSDFCKDNNISIIDIINLHGEYDYLAMRRLSQVIRYGTKHISIITNKSILAAIPSLTLWSILEAINSPKPIELTSSFLHDLKANENDLNNQPSKDFRLLDHKEMMRMSDWLNDMHYTIKRDSSDRGNRK